MISKDSGLAILIDAENASPTLAEAALKLMPHLRRANVKRAYGNSSALSRWGTLISEHCFQPMQTPPSAEKSNATDFALTIDCLDLFHGGRFAEVFIVSSDSDFTQLAMHIRSHGAHVTCIGEDKTPPSFRNACDAFVDCTAASAEPVVQPPSASGPQIDKPRLLALFRRFAATKPEGVRMEAFGLFLKDEWPDYKRGYRNMSQFLRASGLLLLEHNTITLLKSV
jgi:hypothetical protein